MKIVQINTFPYKATGSIMMNLHDALMKNGAESYVVWGRGRDSENDTEIVIKDEIGVKIHGIYTRVTDKTGFASWRATKKLIRKLMCIKPDIVHLHNIHGYYVNIEMLFDYLKNNGVRVIWTFHDCWPFTGHCAYFDMLGCEKWKSGCYSCAQKNTYPSSFFADNSQWNWNRKKELFNGLDLTIVTPSQWLKEIVGQSFLKQNRVCVINNGIEAGKYKPTKTDFYNRLNVAHKVVVLGVASEWAERKGLKDFIKLWEKIDHEKFAVVLIGLDRDQIKKLPTGVIGMGRTSNLEELVGAYSGADFFFDPTYDDNFPTTNLEAIACGTPVITYKTGGSPETLFPDNGWVTEQGDIAAVIKILESENKNKKNVFLPDRFKKESMIAEYLKLYDIM